MKYFLIIFLIADFQQYNLYDFSLHKIILLKDC
jgi:hypothetical protein